MNGEGEKGRKEVRERKERGGGSYRVMYALTLLGFGWEKRGM